MKYVPKPFDPVMVTWEDCYNDATETYDSIQGCIDGYKPCIRKSVGFYVGETPQVIIIATDDDRTNDGCVGGPSFIPRGMVKLIESAAPPMAPKRRR